MSGRFSWTVMQAERAAQRARERACTCFKPYENGPCAVCEAGIEAKEAELADPDPAREEQALERMETRYESWLDRIGGAA
jgi:hypothetical protein